MKTHHSTIGQTLRLALLATTVGFGATAWTAPALAQEDPGAQSVSEDQSQAIVITGSRIQRKDYSANSPIVTVGADTLEKSTTAALEVNLNKLPQFTPAQTPSLGADIQPTATNTPGAATISLRGIGANRTLVLIDGRRGTPSNASGVTDISTIPSAAIERVEIISGGASATYGADAIAGVTNFILKKNFKGLELDGQIGFSQYGDGLEYTLSGIVGTDFPDNRGNVSLAVSMNSRQANFRSERPWYRDMWADPNVGGTQFFVDRPGILFDGALASIFGNPATANPAAGLSTMFPGSHLDLTASGTNGIAVYLDQNGKPYINNSFTDYFGFYGPVGTYYPNFQGYTGPIDNYRYKVSNAGTMSENNTNLYLVLPLTRYNAYARGNYEINDWLGVFGQVMFSNVTTYTKNEGGPITGGWGVQIDPTVLDHDQLPDSYWTLLNSRANPNAPFYITALMPDPRETFTDVTTYNITAGFEGKVPGTDWTWEAVVNKGVSDTYARQTGIYSLERLRAVMSSPNFGKGFDSRVTINPQTGQPWDPNAAYGFFGSSQATCTSGLNLFEPPAGGFSKDCLDAIRSDLKNRSKMDQTIVEANLQGGLFDLPAGQLRFAVGASYRQNKYEFLNDTLTSQGTSFLDQALGIYPSGDSFGDIETRELYAELLVPVIHNAPFMKELSLEIGGRMSDYNTTGTSYTYKILGDWKATDWLRFRGGFNRAERAPNIGELYLSAQQTFGVNLAGDPCSLANPLSWSANPANANGANVRAICEIQMRAIGGESAVNAYYNGTQNSSTFAFAFPTLVGNANLSPEEANTWTAGAVIQSPIAAGILSRLRLSIDWFDIKVNNAIGAQSVAVALQQCYDPALNPLAGSDPAAAAASIFCRNVPRLQTGQSGNIYTTYVNNGRFHLEGIDAQLDWAFPVGPGTLMTNIVGNYMIHIESSALPSQPMVDYVGTSGSFDNGLNGSGFRYRVTTNLNYGVGPANIGLQWQYWPSYKDSTAVLLGSTNTTGGPAYSLFELNGSYRVTKDVSMRFTVDNLFNTRPKYTAVNTAADPTAGTLSGGAFGGYMDDQGRRFSLGINAKF